jgi:hypothetical protein
MWIKCKFDADKFEYSINLNVYGIFSYGLDDNKRDFFIRTVSEWKTIKLKHITGKELCIHIEKLINNNFNGVLTIDEELENLIGGIFPTMDEFNQNK